MINIKFNILQAAIICAPRQDIRYYLNGVYITPKKVVSTDGHRLFAYDVVAVEDFKPFILPRETITDLAKLLTPERKRNGVVDFEVLDGQPRIVCGKYAIEFDPIDGKYPDFQKVIPKQKKARAHSRFNWKYLYDFDRIDKLLSGRGVAHTTLIPYGNHSALVRLTDSNATCVVMPMRS